MFSSSVRRVASTAPSIPIASPFATSVSRTTAAQALCYRSHQRRYSSSKPSSPADGSKGVAQGQGVHATPSQAQAEGDKKSTRASRKKSKDGVSNRKDETVSNLPMVPSTQHIAPLHISASDFFSLHRPISLTHSFPVEVTDEAFASIFMPRTKKNTKPTDVMATLSRTINSIDTVTGNLNNLKVGSQEDQYNEEADELRNAISQNNQKSDVQHSESVPEGPTMMFPRHILSGKYMAFNPPPAPVPMDTAESLAAGAEAAAQQEPQHRTYTAVLTIKESTDENGDVTYEAHSGPLIADEQTIRPANTPFLDRMQIRQERYWMQQTVEDSGMYAISVKRQRKLKMKKHKYKKLMRRTRNLRRRLDRN